MWSGSAVLGVGVLVYTGRVGVTDAHRHAAHQIVRMRTGQVYVDAGQGSVGPVNDIVIAGGVSHALRPDSVDAFATTIYVDVDTDLGRRIRDVCPRGLVWGDAEKCFASGELWSPASEGGAAAAWAQRFIAGHSAGTTVDAVDGVHRFVRSAVAAASTRLAGPVSLGAVAAEINVSVPHLSRLWRRDLGISFPAWVRWMRLREAARLVGAGASITEAAYGAGFADGAHASRVCREMFGLTPAELVGGVTVV